jgi:hypothetical protein
VDFTTFSGETEPTLILADDAVLRRADAKAVPLSKISSERVSRRRFFGMGATATGAVLAGASLPAAASTPAGVDPGAGFGAATGFTNFTSVPVVPGAQVLSLGLYNIIPLDGALRFDAGGVYNEPNGHGGAAGTMGTTLSLPAGSRIVRIDTYGLRDTVGRQFWFVYQRNLLTGSTPREVGRFETPQDAGDMQASYTTPLDIAAGDIINVDIGDTSVGNRVVGIVVQYLEPASVPATPAGLFTAVTPTRVFDSRAAAPAPGLLAPRSSLVVSVKDGRDGAGAVSVADLVPANATAVTFNVTATGTTGPNFLSVTPGDATSSGASTVNWGGGSDVANATVSKLDGNRQLKVFLGDQAGSTNVIIDITGYYV